MALTYKISLKDSFPLDEIGQLLSPILRHEGKVTIASIDGITAHILASTDADRLSMREDFDFEPTVNIYLRFLGGDFDTETEAFSVALQKIAQQCPGDLIITRDESLLGERNNQHQWLSRRLLWDDRFWTHFPQWESRD